jgi:UDP-N-acetyl-D-mannosaminuronic acid dehydrogenase
VLAATRAIAPFVQPGNFVILESTSPVGTTQLVAEELARANPDIGTFHVAYCPERVLPGRIMAELVENDRIVGGVTEEATRVVAKFYREFVKGEVLGTDSVTAEMCKLTENCFRDVNIAFANELSLISAKAGIDVWELIRLANHHPRVNILTPGTGVGGHCIAVDPWFVVASDPENSRLIKTARQVNLGKTQWVIDQVKSASKEAEAVLGRPPRIACLGLAFKPDIDDIRESPAVEVVRALEGFGCDLLVVEPHLERSAAFRLVGLDTALKDADIVAVLVNHRAFQSIQDELPDSTRVLNFVTSSGTG